MDDYQGWLTTTAEHIGLSFGGEQVPYTEIKCWMELSSVVLSLWEIETIHEISGHYVSALRQYEKENSMPPYVSEEELERQAAIKAKQKEHYVEKLNNRQRQKLKRKV